MAALLAFSGNVRYPNEILGLPMFLQISKDTAVQLVHKYCQGEGTYLFRPSSERNESYFCITLSVSPQGNVSHIKVYIRKDRTANRGRPIYYVAKSREFSSFMDFVRYYHSYPICCEKGINVRLLRGLGYRQGQGDAPRERKLHIPGFNARPVGRRISEPSEHTGEHLSDRPPASGVRDRHGRIARIGSSPDILPSHEISRQPVMPQRSASLHSGAAASSSSSSSYSNYKAISQKAQMDPRNRPPPPIPRRREDDCMPTYFEVDPNKDFFAETYTYLKETEMCECGLRVVDSTLPLGWTIHKVANSLSKTRIFFQHGDEETSWEMPLEIVPLMTSSQILFIHELCQEVGSRVPACLHGARAMMQEDSNLRGSRISSNSSSSSCSSSSTISQGSGNAEGQGLATSPFAGADQGPYEAPLPLMISDSTWPATSPTPEAAQSARLPAQRLLGQQTYQGSHAPTSDQMGADGSGLQMHEQDPQQGQSSGWFPRQPLIRGGNRAPSFDSIHTRTIQARSGPPSTVTNTTSESGPYMSYNPCE